MLAVRLPKALLGWLNRYARRRKITRTDAVEQAVREMKERENGAPD